MPTKIIRVDLIFDNRNFNLDVVTPEYVARILKQKGITQDFIRGGPVAHISEIETN